MYCIELWCTREVWRAREKCQSCWGATESNSSFLSACLTLQNHEDSVTRPCLHYYKRNTHALILAPISLSGRELTRVDESCRELTRVEESRRRLTRFDESGRDLTRIVENWRELSRIDENCRELSRIDENWRELTRIVESWRQLKRVDDSWRESARWHRWLSSNFVFPPFGAFPSHILTSV